MKFTFLKSFMAGIVIMMTTFANAGLIAINDGSINFNAADYTNGYGLLGDANFIDINYINSLNQFGDNVIIKVSMGVYTDYYKPVDGVSILDMLTSWNKHTWASNPGASFITPDYYNSNHLGGSAWEYPTANISGDSRGYLSFWGSQTGYGGGCCDAGGGNPKWGLAFKVETVSNVPEPSTLAIFALGMIGLASRRFKKQS
jgi:hypothetical protein